MQSRTNYYTCWQIGLWRLILSSSQPNPLFSLWDGGLKSLDVYYIYAVCILFVAVAFLLLCIFFIMMIWLEIQYLSSSSMIYVNSVFLIDYLMVTLLDSVRLSILRGRIVSRTHETGSHVIFSLNEWSLLLWTKATVYFW